MNHHTLTPDERYVLAIYRELSPAKRQYALDQLKTLVGLGETGVTGDRHSVITWLEDLLRQDQPSD